MFWSPNVRLYRQFRRHIANPRQVYIEKSSIRYKSIIKSRRRSFSASVPSETPEVQKSRIKVSKDERKAMVETFVNKYKAMNAGKFPTASQARKETGGSYYVIRQILQELEYNSKMSSMCTKDLSSVENYSTKKNVMSTEELSGSSVTSQDAQKTNEILVGEEFIKGSESSTDAAEVSGNFSTFDADTSEDGQIRNKILMENQNSNYVATKPHRGVGEAEESMHSHPEKPEDNVKEDTGSEDKLKFDGLKPKAKQRKSSWELYKEPSEDAESQGKSSVWENLKSLANGFLGIWKKHL
ncbi:unnamed protein product [Fraxinus pennsylvanica]|uniref:AT3G52170-like helix-turn-helix domain-containing protein n=1 Tax=Fraxinus pennsylvanica TaxID=56036 RepID=A0AAD2DZW2_9LAMI|nr:unnamed protein product [Fraxinus pennsylvanica]